MTDDDLRFTPPQPRTGSRLRIMATRVGDEVVTDSIIDPPRRARPTFEAIRKLLGPIDGAVFACGCAVRLNAEERVELLDRCAEHKKSPPR